MHTLIITQKDRHLFINLVLFFISVFLSFFLALPLPELIQSPRQTALAWMLTQELTIELFSGASWMGTNTFQLSKVSRFPFQVLLVACKALCE